MLLTILLSSLDSLMRNLYFCILNRPHDRVSLKEMKVDWHACLDNKVGFKVSLQTLCSLEYFQVLQLRIMHLCSPSVASIS